MTDFADLASRGQLTSRDISQMRERITIERARQATADGLPAVVEFIAADGPYFYLHLYPCRPLSPGAQWRAGMLTPQMFVGAAMRSYEGIDGDRALEVIGTCDKRMVDGIYWNHLPWAQLHLRGFRVPRSPHPWIGNPNVRCTLALGDLFSPRVDHFEAYDRRLERVRSGIAWTKENIDRLEREGRFHALPTSQSHLDRLEREESEIEHKLALDRLKLSIERKVGHR